MRIDVEIVKRSRAIIKENPMLRLGRCPVEGETCKMCKFLIGDAGICPEPECELRGKKAHDPNWAACAKFITWKKWREQRMEVKI
jgi:hypothetical protein